LKISVHKYFQGFSSAAPLVVFRMVLGTMLFLSTVRFWANGWIADLYIAPKIFFPFYGFEFIVPLGNYTYLLFAMLAFSAVLVAIGLYYRMAMVSLFLSFTYIELIDKSTYLNHYYFISLICFLMIFLPAQVAFSVDAFRNKKIAASFIPTWTIDVIKLMVCILYFFAGLAKINPDWLLHALPLKIWLPARNDMPIIGGLFNYKATAYVFSWVGCVYDLAIPFLLWYTRTRLWAYLAVIVFHVLTAMLFPIGMFPYIMMVTALIFFSASFHEKIIALMYRVLQVKGDITISQKAYQYQPVVGKLIQAGLLAFFVWQLLMPLRYLAYPGQLFWTEQGYRFSWRVMLMEKAGYAEFTIIDNAGRKMVVNNAVFLTPLQEKMMTTQPDMILQFAHFLRDYYHKNGFTNPKVYVDSYVSLNGMMGRPLVLPTVDLAKEDESFLHKNWLLLYEK